LLITDDIIITILLMITINQTIIDGY